jgi:hypothetical protein
MAKCMCYWKSHSYFDERSHCQGTESALYSYLRLWCLVVFLHFVTTECFWCDCMNNDVNINISRNVLSWHLQNLFRFYWVQHDMFTVMWQDLSTDWWWQVQLAHDLVGCDPCWPVVGWNLTPPLVCRIAEASLHKSGEGHHVPCTPLPTRTADPGGQNFSDTTAPVICE